jgi:uncharacterized membrane protein YphA (DoxX/SURF4 family)
MTSLSFVSHLHWLDLAARVVGIVFVWTGAIKAIAPHTFRQHLGRLGWVPRQILAATVSATAFLEVGLGTALVLGVAPRFTLPATLAILLVLSVVSWWGVKSGKTDDCGCYGGYIQPSIAQSLGLNSVFALVVLSAWLAVPRDQGTILWQLMAVALAAVAATGISALAQRHEMREGKYLFQTNPLKIGARWRKPWAASAVDAAESEVIVCFLGPDCPYCIQWVRFLNAMHKSPQLPRVIGVVAATDEREHRFVQERGIDFPLVHISPSLMARLSPAVPTTVRIEFGTIADIWTGAMPPALYGRFREAFFPNAASEPVSSESSSASSATFSTA